MEIEPQAQQDGTLTFVVAGRGTIATLNYGQLVLLDMLARPAAFVHLMARQSQRSRRLRERYTRWLSAPLGQSPPVAVIGPNWRQRQAPRLWNDLLYLRRLGLLRMERGHVEISAHGRRFMRWLVTEWPGWPRYARQFPLA